MNDLDNMLAMFGNKLTPYKFYNGTVTLLYDDTPHVYYLIKEDGTLEAQDGVTTTCHIVDKSHILIPWACKKMAEKFIGLVNPHTEIDKDLVLKYITESKSAHKDILDDAGDIGKQAHALIENHINLCIGKVDNQVEVLDKDNRVTSCVIAALSWMSNHNVRWVSTERKIYSKLFGYAGTMDGLAHVDSCNDPKCCKSHFKDRLSLIDWKSSNGLYIEYLLQTAAYKYAYEEETGEEITDRWIVQLGKEDGTFNTWHVESEDDYLDDLEAFLSCLSLARTYKVVEDRVNGLVNAVKDAKRAEKKAEKEAQLLIKCSYSNRYKGVRYPRCNGGNPCETCLKKYNEKHLTKEP